MKREGDEGLVVLISGKPENQTSTNDLEDGGGERTKEME